MSPSFKRTLFCIFFVFIHSIAARLTFRRKMESPEEVIKEMREVTRKLQDEELISVENIIASINFPDVENNVVEISYILDLNTLLTLNNVAVIVFQFNFGNPDLDSVEVFLNDIQLPNNFFNLEEFQNGLVVRSVDIDGNEIDPGFFTFEYKFAVENLICNHPAGGSAIAATWINFFQSNLAGAQPKVVGVDYTVPFTPEELNFTIQPPGVGEEVVNDNGDGSMTVFVTYNPQNIGLGQGFDSENIFFRFNQDVVEEANNCIILEEGNGVIVFFVVVIAMVICCVGSALLLNRHFDRVEARRRRERRAANLLNYPGSPDIVLAPGGDAANTTVRAVLEDDDPEELNAIGPVTTIQVQLTGVDNEENDEDNLGSTL